MFTRNPCLSDLVFANADRFSFLLLTEDQSRSSKYTVELGDFDLVLTKTLTASSYDTACDMNLCTADSICQHEL